MTEIGNRLKQEREAKNMSLEDLQTTTKIQKRYLIGIEEGNYAIMPGKFYARAFLKQYAEAVGLDPEELFEEYQSEIPVNDKDEIPALSRVKTRKKVPSKGNSKVMNFLPKLFMLFALIAVCAIIYILVLSFSNGEDNQTVPQQQEAPAEIDAPNQTEDSDAEETPAEDEAIEEDVQEEEPVEETPANGTLTEVEKSGTSATLELKDTDQFIVEITSPGETWIEVDNAKGNNFYYGLVKEGQTETLDLSQEEEIIFKVGRSFETDISINGEPFEFPFPTDEITTQIITIKFMPTGEQ
ncbi:helix-turn-helix domain-containing protein [Sutcliffiella deserti]|uniref:helix-turn-helix domain-containing protein n=1 Tax=Sutcliffiella deserti TaxID=2875501 RepID=UPI001CBDD4C9|nr:RodZ domain-containing protein [Sutcliffiella deserti]